MSSTETAPDAVTEDDFVKLMTTMQTHFTAPAAGKRPLFALPAHVMAMAAPARLATLAVDDVARPAPPRVIASPAVIHVARPALTPTQQSAAAFVEAHRQAVQAALGKVHAPADTADFVRQMQALEQREQAEQTARIDAMYKSMIAAGRANPFARPAILAASNHTSSFLSGLVHDAHDALHGVVKAVSGAAHAAESAGKSVTQWAGHAAQSVGKFFSSLF